MSQSGSGLNDYTDNNEQLLKAMGFNDENEIKQALCLSNNDINEAVAILTNEKPSKMTALNNSSSTHHIENDIDMAEIDHSSPSLNKDNKEQVDKQIVEYFA